MFMHVINRPCGHSMGVDCDCPKLGGGFATTSGEVTIPADGITRQVVFFTGRGEGQIYNGLCYCRGGLDQHPFHAARPFDVKES